jgi:nucleotide-sensitive chloride channel 1A
LQEQNSTRKEHIQARQEQNKGKSVAHDQKHNPETATTMSGALRVIEQVPKVDDFTSLETHQQETPNTFYGAKAVLHHRVANASLKVSERELTTNSALRALRTSAGPGAAPHASPGAHSNGDGVVPRVEVTITRIQIWVTSE